MIRIAIEEIKKKFTISLDIAVTKTRAISVWNVTE